MEKCVPLKHEKIMVAIDLSDYSEATFVEAYTLAKAFGAELIILNVINTKTLESVDHLGHMGFDFSREEFARKIRKQRRANIEEEYLSQLGEVKGRLIFRVGAPATEIVDAAREEGVSLLVVNSKGRGDLAHTLFGSVAEKVFRHAPCPVVSVRGPEHCRLPEA